MGTTDLTIITIFALTLASLLLSRRVIDRGAKPFRLRPISAYDALRKELGMSIESGRRPLFTLGTGALQGAAGPASIAGLKILDELVETTGSGQLAPFVTVGSGTLLPIAGDRLKGDGDAFRRRPDTTIPLVQFVADESFPFAFAAGTADIIQHENLENSIAVGRFGAELAFIGEASSRANVEQIMGSDDPPAIAIALATTGNSLWGEEIFAAGAYLRGTPGQLATVRAQDILRWLLVIALLIAALGQALGLI